MKILLNDNTFIELNQQSKTRLNEMFAKEIDFSLDEYVYYSPIIEYKNILKWTLSFTQFLKSLNLELKEYIPLNDDVEKQTTQYVFIIKQS